LSQVEGSTGGSGSGSVGPSGLGGVGITGFISLEAIVKYVFKKNVNLI
jgi:hypothetical protein